LLDFSGRFRLQPIKILKKFLIYETRLMLLIFTKLWYRKYLCIFTTVIHKYFLTLSSHLFYTCLALFMCRRLRRRRRTRSKVYGLIRSPADHLEMRPLDKDDDEDEDDEEDDMTLFDQPNNGKKLLRKESPLKFKN